MLAAAGAEHLVVGEQHRLLLLVPGPLEPVLVPGDLGGGTDDHGPPGQLDRADGVLVGHDLHEPVPAHGVDADGRQIARQLPEAEGQVGAAVAGEVAVVRLEHGAPGAARTALAAVGHPPGRLGVGPFA